MNEHTHCWTDITCISDNRMTYFCHRCGAYQYKSFCVDVDKQRAEPDTEILRQLGHFMEDV